MPRLFYEVAVLGLGAMGTFACLELSRRGISVIGLDRFAPPHDRGSHSGDTRVFRLAAPEGTHYVPLAKRAGVLWDKLGEDAGKRFLHRSGLLRLGTKEDPAIFRTQESALIHGLRLEELSADEVTSRFPAFEGGSGLIGLFEPSAGWLDVNAALSFGLQQARRWGAELRLETPVVDWGTEGDQFRIDLERERVLARRVIVTAGAWTAQILGELNLPLEVVRKVMAWIEPAKRDLFQPEVLSPFAHAPSTMYGFPDLENRGVKLAFHRAGGTRFTKFEGSPIPDPQPSDIEPLIDLARKLMPGLIDRTSNGLDQVRQAKTCLYTMTPDADFLIDRHPHFERVYFATGFSGHGFKFAPVIGEALADLILDDHTELPINFLRLKERFYTRES